VTDFKKQATWKGISDLVLEKSKERHTKDIENFMKEAQAKHRKERSMNSIKEYMIRAIQKKQIEIYGKKLTLKEQILALNNPVLREKLL
jgi:hypothetical protein